MRQIVSAACGLWLALAGTAAAQLQDGLSQPAVVVELFTSQGCSSCPPADRLLADLAQDPRVIPLALHVDYWDYLGWADPFARPEFTKRQKAYARVAGTKMVYTPQMIVGGQDRVVGNRPAEVAATIERHLSGSPGVGQHYRLTVTRDGDTLTIRAEAVPPSDRTLRLQLVRYRPQDRVMIERGENAGQDLSYVNIVTSWQALADWTASAPLSITAPAPGSDPAVVILQADGMAEIVAATQLR